MRLQCDVMHARENKCLSYKSFISPIQGIAMDAAPLNFRSLEPGDCR